MEKKFTNQRRHKYNNNVAFLTLLLTKMVGSVQSFPPASSRVKLNAATTRETGGAGEFGDSILVLIQWWQATCWRPLMDDSGTAEPAASGCDKKTPAGRLCVASEDKCDHVFDL